MNNEKLIEEAAKAIWMVRYGTRSGWIAAPEDWRTRIVPQTENEIQREAEAALAVFEKVLGEGIDDERKAAMRVMRQMEEIHGFPTYEECVDAILAAGFRRSVAFEPSAEPKHDEWCNHCQVCGEGIRYGSRCREHYQNQPQGEPSDAQVPTVEEWGAKIQAEQTRAASKGYTAEHDAEHGIRHLLNWAIDYSRQGNAIASSGLILSALDLFDALTPESGVSFDPDVLRLVTELRALRAAGVGGAR